MKVEHWIGNQEPRLVALTLVGLIILGLAMKWAFLFLALCCAVLLSLLRLNQCLRRIDFRGTSTSPRSRRRFL